MLKWLSEWFYRISTSWLTLLGLLIFLLFMAVVLPNQAAKSAAYAGDVGSVDTSYLIGVDDIFRIAEAYGAEGRAAYVYARLTFDSIFPLAYGLFLLTGISFIFKRIVPSGSWLRLLNLTPLLGMLFDYLENITISIVMNAYPEKLLFPARMVTVFTPLKWVFVNGSMGILLIALLAWPFVLLRARRAAKKAAKN